MSGGTHMRAVGPEGGADAPGATAAAADEPLTLDASWAEDAPADEAWDEVAPRVSRGWVVPTLAVMAVVGWSGFFGWAHRAELLTGVTPQGASQLVVAWAVPVLLVLALCLLALRL